MNKSNMKRYLRYSAEKYLDNRKSHHKQFGVLQVKDSGRIHNMLSIRSLRRVKYIANLKHFVQENPNSFKMIKKLDYYLGRRRAFPGNVKIIMPVNKVLFLRNIKRIEKLSLILDRITLQNFKVMNKFIKKIFIVGMINFIMQLNSNTDLSSILRLSKIYTRRKIYGFHIPRVTDHILEYKGFKYLRRISTLNLGQFDPDLIASILLKASFFPSLKELYLGNLQITSEFPAMMGSCFSNFINLQILDVTINCTNEENTKYLFLTLEIPRNCRKLSLEFTNIAFPDAGVKTNEWEYFNNFCRNLSKLTKIEELSLQFRPNKNFTFINHLISNFPKSQTLKKIIFQALLMDPKQNLYQDNRIKMKEFLEWCCSCADLEILELMAVNRDYTGIGKLNLPSLKHLIKLETLLWDTPSTDTLKIEDYHSFLNFIDGATQLESLGISIESSNFDLQNFNKFCETLGRLQNLQEINLHLNCRKFEILDYTSLENNLKRLNHLKILRLMFTSEEVKEKQYWKEFLINLFEKYQTLTEFYLSLWCPSGKIFLKTYPVSGVNLRQSMLDYIVK